MSVRLSRRAQQDLREYLIWVAERNIEAARRFVDELDDLLDDLDQHSFEGPEVRLTTGQVVRTWPLAPMRVYYQRRGSVLYVVRVHHQARRPITR